MSVVNFRPSFPPPLISHDRVFPDRVFLDRVYRLPQGMVTHYNLLPITSTDWISSLLLSANVAQSFSGKHNY